MAEPRPVPRIDDILVGGRVVEVRDHVQDRASRQKRRRLVCVLIGLHPAVVVAGAVERLDQRAVNRLDAHPHAGGVHVRLEHRQLHGLRQRLVGVDALVRLHALEVDVARADVHHLFAKLRLIALGMELEPDLEVGGRVLPVRMQVHRRKDHLRSSPEQPARVRVEDVGVSSHFVHGPSAEPAARSALRDDRHHGVMEHEEAADRGATFLLPRVIHFLDFDRRDVTILGHAGGRGREHTPPVWADRLHAHGRCVDDEIGRADLPGVGVGPHARRRHIGRAPLRRAAVGPFRDRGDFGVAERDVVLEVLNAQIFFDEPRRHHAALVAQPGALLDGSGKGPHFFIADEGHRRERIGPMAALAAALQNRRDVLGECHRAGAGLLAGRGRQGGSERENDERA